MRTDLTLTIQGLKLPQKFHVVDNLNYNLILGLDFMSNRKAYIDFGKNTLSICNDLVIEHLVPQKLPGNISHVISNCTIPHLQKLSSLSLVTNHLTVNSYFNLCLSYVGKASV